MEDGDFYGSSGIDKDMYVESIATTDADIEAEKQAEISALMPKAAKRNTFTAPQSAVRELEREAENHDPMEAHRASRVSDREDEYKQRRRQRIISPERHDPFAAGDQTPDASVRTYKDIMAEQALNKEKEAIMRQVKEKMAEEQESKKRGFSDAPGGAAVEGAKRRRWDSAPGTDASAATTRAGFADGGATPNLADGGATPMAGGAWDEAPSADGGATPSRWDAPTPGGGASRRNRWDETPDPSALAGGATPGGDRKIRSRWDETPVANSGGATPMVGGMMGATPVGGMDMQTPLPSQLAQMTPEQMNEYRFQRDVDERNRPWDDEELNALFPQEGYEILQPPAGYQPAMTPSRKLLATPTPGGTPQYSMPADKPREAYDVPQTPGDGALPFVKPEDYQFFAPLMEEKDESEMSKEEAGERRIMKLLLKIKNGTPPMRKQALRQITDKAREFGPGPLFNQILPLLMSPTLEDQERHLLVKVIDRVLYKLDDLVRPYAHKILVVIEPLLIDEDYYARVEGREIIANLSKAAGLATMIATMRPDIDNLDEYVRNTTARAFAVVASALGIPALLPFLKAVCQSKKSWQARHTGVKIIQQIAILMGCAVLPHLKKMVEIMEAGLTDEQQKVRTITALSLAALAEAATPYGIEAFDIVLKPLWIGARAHHGKVLAAFLKAVGFIIPLMEPEHSGFYTREIMPILIREFQTPDEEMKKIVMKVVKQCVGTEGVDAEYVRTEILPDFFTHLWVRRMALDRRNYRQLVDTTVELAQKVGGAEIIGRLAEGLKDESEPYRKMVMETIDKVVTSMGTTDIDTRLEELMIDGMLFAFQEQQSEDTKVMLDGVAAVVNSFRERVKPYLPQICGTLKWRLNNKSAKVRQQSADLIGKIAAVMKRCGEDQLLNHLGVVLYEYLGEEYPEVLGSILGGLKGIVNVVGMSKMTPPIKDLLPRLTPILRNRHEKVQENCIDLVGRIADRGAEFVSAKEWMRICFELLDMLKAHKKAIRRATVNTFGYIAKAIGPQDVLAVLLNNLKVQERQNRVCTTVAIAIVAETCGPFTVLPALLNEYRLPEMNVQNGVLKALSFLFEYIGEMGKDYVYAVAPLLEDALMDRDLVHRQTAASVVKHLTLGVTGLGCEDALEHLMNFVWPNVFEQSPHVINAVTDAIEAMRVSLGATRLLQHCLPGLFHPARKVREAYWKVYNNLYIGSQDAMIPAFPLLEDDVVAENNYRRVELEYVL